MNVKRSCACELEISRIPPRGVIYRLSRARRVFAWRDVTHPSINRGRCRSTPRQQVDINNNLVCLARCVFVVDSTAGEIKYARKQASKHNYIIVRPKASWAG